MVQVGVEAIAYSFRDIRNTIRMEGCNGRDQVVRQVVAEGWRSYEAPLPLMISQLTSRRATAFFDVGANTGYYSLVAACAGARFIQAFEPVSAIADLCQRNLGHTFQGQLPCPVEIHRIALADHDGEAELFIPDQGHGLIETSASLNPHFRARHSGMIHVRLRRLDAFLEENPIPDDCQLLMKVDVESCEPQVLAGAETAIRSLRPLIILEILPGADLAFYAQWLARFRYRHFHLVPPNQLVAADLIQPSLAHRDHLLLPEEIDEASLFGIQEGLPMAN